MLNVWRVKLDFTAIKVLGNARIAKMVNTLTRQGKESVNHVRPAHIRQKVKIRHVKFAEWVNIRMKKTRTDAKNAPQVYISRSTQSAV
jgi:capsular polysaccharide biosynthesis protein